MRSGADNRPGSLLRFRRVSEGGGVFHKDSGTYEHGFGAELHDKRGIGWSGNSAGRKIRDRQLPFSSDDLDQLIGRLMLFRLGEQFLFTEHGENFHLLNNLTNVLDRMNHVAGTGLTL